MLSLAALTGCAERHLGHYIDIGGPRAFNTYDRQGNPDRLEPVDCLAPALLSVPISYGQVVPLFQPDGAGASLLEAMQAVLGDRRCVTADFLDVRLDDREGPWHLVDRALALSGNVKGIKAVAVTKILHRKRPHLVPIFDSSVYRFYTGEVPPVGACRDTPRTLWPLYQSDLRAHRRWLTELASHTVTPDGRPLSLLRAADIVIWEHEVTGCEAAGVVPA
ncbi:DUF6308 family protein [Streptomyces sp. NPDC088194]|uniref:DUF6308 family protein n=1 Tax=Streptomyces sp. NPDC088194 TaxID=3154931 RepID=UPI00344B08E3